MTLWYVFFWPLVAAGVLTHNCPPCPSRPPAPTVRVFSPESPPLLRSERRAWWIDGVLAEKARQWEEEARQVREEEECRKMGRRWVDVDGDQVMDTEDEIADLSESWSEDDEDDPEEIKVLKV